MSRKPVAERLRQVSELAADMVIEHGYAGFRLADLAARIGLTEAALYRYVEGKDALVHAAFVTALHPGSGFAGTSPLPTAARRETVAVIERFLEEQSPLKELKRLVSRKGVPASAGSELEGLVVALYRALLRYRRALKLIERVAAEWPELEAVWFGGRRAEFLAALQTYFARRIKQGLFAGLPDAETAATVLVETVTYFAMTRHFERYPLPGEDERIEQTLRLIFRQGYAAPNPCELL